MIATVAPLAAGIETGCTGAAETGPMGKMGPSVGPVASGRGRPAAPRAAYAVSVSVEEKNIAWLTAERTCSCV
jgi:hypothetical protein